MGLFGILKKQKEKARLQLRKRRLLSEISVARQFLRADQAVLDSIERGSERYKETKAEIDKWKIDYNGLEEELREVNIQLGKL